MLMVQPFANRYYVSETVVSQDMLDHIYQIKQEDKGVSISNVNGWHSTTMTVAEPWIEGLIKQLTSELQGVYLDFGLHKEPKLANYWININGTNGFNKVHKHPGCYFSACVYLKVPKNSGDFVFVREDSLNDFIPRFNELNNLNNQEFTITPNEGDIIYFPSSMPHFVMPNNSEEDRISIAVNFV